MESNNDGMNDAPVEAPAPEQSITLTASSLRDLIKGAIQEAITPIQEELEKAKTIQAFESANADAPQYNGVYRGRRDSARHVTIGTRAAAENPQDYDHVVSGVAAMPREKEQ